MGKKPKELENLVELPESMRYIWKYFTALNRKRSSSGYGPLPISYSDVLSYFILHNIQYDPLEVELLELLDDIALEHYNKEIQKETSKNNKK